MKIEVSVGEAIDKYNILEIKHKNINDENKQNLIKNELNELCSCIDIIKRFPLYYKMLTFVNQQIWSMTDIIKSTDVGDPNYAYISHNIFDFNQKRFRIKSFFNSSAESKIKEQKSYALSVCRIHLDNIETFYKKIPEVNYLSIDFDMIVFDTKYEANIKHIFDQTNIIFDNDITVNKTIALAEFGVYPIHRDIFDFDPIQYICGGLLGDFIQSLSIPYEKFKRTGRRANIYLADGFGGDNFRFGLQNTYNDIFDIISKQFYIKEFKMYSGETNIDINLNDWRRCPKLYKANLYEIYKTTFDTEWGNGKWLFVDSDSSFRTKWEDKIVINTTYYRFPDNIDFQELYNKYDGKLVFVSNQPQEYAFFLSRTFLKISHYNPSSFTELCNIISSCQLFIGSLSSPLSIAHAIDKKRIMGLMNNCIDNIAVSGLEQKWSNMIHSTFGKG